MFVLPQGTILQSMEGIHTWLRAEKGERVAQDGKRVRSRKAEVVDEAAPAVESQQEREEGEHRPERCHAVAETVEAEDWAEVTSLTCELWVRVWDGVRGLPDIQQTYPLPLTPSHQH